MSEQEFPSNWDSELHELRRRIRVRLNWAARTIVREESSKILGRIKIYESMSLGSHEYFWTIEREEK